MISDFEFKPYVVCYLVESTSFEKNNLLVAIIRDNFDKQPWSENSESFAIYSTTRHFGKKGE